MVTASPHYPIPKNNDIIEYKMNEAIDDILNLMKTNNDDDDKQIVNLILKGDDLNELAHKMFDAGYEPSIQKLHKRITHVGIKLNKTTFIIKTQQLVPDSLDGEVSVSSEIVYNNMNKAMTIFNKSLFKNEHKSCYTHQDVKILDGNRTVVPIGRLTEADGEIIEIDICKAFSSAFRSIKEIPIFNEFDNFETFDNHKIKQLSLYIVSAKNNKFVS